MNIKKLIIILVLCVFMAITMPAAVSAHTLKTNNGIGAVIHIDPDDDPIANDTSSFYFEIKDEKGQFQMKDCNCTAKIFQDDIELFSEAIGVNSQSVNLENSAFAYKFPEKGVYQVILEGTSVSKAFPDFKLQYDIRVERDKNTPSTDKSLIVIILGGILLFGIVFGLILFSGKKTPTSPTGKKLETPTEGSKN